MKVALQTVWDELPQQNQQDGGELYQALDCLRGCHWRCSNSVHVGVARGGAVGASAPPRAVKIFRRNLQGNV